MSDVTQMRAWALDRAIETLKIAATGPIDPVAVKAIADDYTAYVLAPVPQDETAKVDAALGVSHETTKTEAA